MPPQTTLDNYKYIPHLEQLLLWFLDNDSQIKLLISPTIEFLFEEGYRPISSKENDPNLLEEMANQNGHSLDIDIIERWIVIRTWLDLAAAENISVETGKDLDECIEERIDLLEEYTAKTLLDVGNIMHKYDIEPTVQNLDEELSKISILEEKEKFKQNYLIDTLISSEMRFLAWIYKELFNKEYKIKQH